MAFAYRNSTFFNRPASSYIGESADTVTVPHIICDVIDVSGGMVIGTDITTTGRVTGATMTCTTAPAAATDVVRLNEVATILPTSTTVISPLWNGWDEDDSSLVVFGAFPVAENYILTRIGSKIECVHSVSFNTGGDIVVPGNFHLTRTIFNGINFVPDPVIPVGYRPDNDTTIPITVVIDHIGHTVGMFQVMANGEVHIGAYNATATSRNFTGLVHIAVEPFVAGWFSTPP